MKRERHTYLTLQTVEAARQGWLDRISADTPDCTENSLKTHVSNLRGKLRDVSGRDYVEAVWGIGFRLNAGS